VYTPNAFAFLGARSLLLRSMYFAIEQVLGHWCTDALICVSSSEMELAAERGVAPRERLIVVENAIDATCFPQESDRWHTRSQLGIGAGQVAIGYVGRLARQKGVGILIDSAKWVVEQVPSVRFVMVGEGEQERAVRKKILAYGLEDHVKLTGFRTDIPQLLAALDIFVLPSEYEGLPYTLMEAMATGCTAVATDVGGNRDLVEDGVTGALVPPSDPGAIAEVLLRLIEQPDERDRLGMAARRAARARTTPQQMAAEVTKLYGKLLEEKGNRV
jgi:glycosyltransferase involved in cell wall biosynthesis